VPSPASEASTVNVAGFPTYFVRTYILNKLSCITQQTERMVSDITNLWRHKESIRTKFPITNQDKH